MFKITSAWGPQGPERDGIGDVGVIEGDAPQQLFGVFVQGGRIESHEFLGSFLPQSCDPVVDGLARRGASRAATSSASPISHFASEKLATARARRPD